MERYRARHGITDPIEAFGAEPADQLERIAWRKAQRDLGRHRHVGERSIGR